MLPPNPLQLQLVRYFLQAPLHRHNIPRSQTQFLLHPFEHCSGPVEITTDVVPSSLYLQVLAALHQILDVIDGRKEQVEDLEELVFLLGEPRVRQELYQVAKVVAAVSNRRSDLSNQRLHSLINRILKHGPVEGEPLDVFTQHQTRCHEELSKVKRVNSFFFVFFKLEAGVL